MRCVFVACAFLATVSNAAPQQAHARDPFGAPAKPATRKPAKEDSGGSVAPQTVRPGALVGGSDDCATADVITGTGSFAFSNASATTGAQGQSNALCNFFGQTGIDRDVWFAWTAPASGTAEFATCAGTSVDTKIAVYAGTGCPSGAPLACNDDACGLRSRATFSASAGSAYLLQLGTYPGASGGSGTFTLTVTPPLANDSCATPAAISGPGPFAFDLTSATTGSEGQNELACTFSGTAAIAQDAWFAWTAGFSGTAEISTCGGATIDTKLAVYAGGGCPASSAIACNDDACASLQSNASFAVTAGNVYAIQLGLYLGASSGTGTFAIQQVTPPSNDGCSTPIAIAGAGPHAFDNTYATTGSQGQRSGACADYGTSSIARDEWFTWTAAANGSATITSCGLTSVDTRIAVYDGAGCPTSDAIACNDDACGSTQSTLSFATRTGRSYSIQVGSWPGAGGGAGAFTISEQGGITYGGLEHVPLGGAQLQLNGSGGLDVMNLGNLRADGVAILLPQSRNFCAQMTTGTCPFTYSPTWPDGTALELCASNALENFAAVMKFTHVGSNVEIHCDFSSDILCNYWTLCDTSDMSIGEACLTPDPMTAEASIPDDACIYEVDYRTWGVDKDGYRIQFDPPTTVTLGTIAVPGVKSLTVVPDALSGTCLVTPNRHIEAFSIYGTALSAFTISMEVVDPPVQPGMPFCFGDGTGTACPCGNSGAAGHGCANSVDPSGALLQASGAASLASDTLVLAASNMPSSSVLYFQGTTQVSAVFGDGLRCAGGSVNRLGTKTNVAGASSYPGAGDPPVSVQGLVPGPGASRTYQVWYRNAGAFCTSATFNLSNGYQLVWGP